MRTFCPYCQIKLESTLLECCVSCLPLLREKQKKEQKAAKARKITQGLLAFFTLLVIFGIWKRDDLGDRFGAEKSKAEYRDRAISCASEGKVACAIRNWKKVVEKAPEDTGALANLAMLLSQEEQYGEALPHFERYIALGGGAYDSFAWYARVLKSLGERKKAISWYYKTLQLNPRLADITAELAEALVVENQTLEAMSVLAAFPSPSRKPYFQARLLALQSGMAKQALDKNIVLRLPKIDGHYFIPIQLGNRSEPEIFMIDSGATSIMFRKSLLDDKSISFKEGRGVVKFKTADGRVINGKDVTVGSLRMGNLQIKDVQASTCDDCSSLFGQAGLERFDMRTAKEDGLEFLYLTPRA